MYSLLLDDFLLGVQRCGFLDGLRSRRLDHLARRLPRSPRLAVRHLLALIFLHRRRLLGRMGRLGLLRSDSLLISRHLLGLPLDTDRLLLAGRSLGCLNWSLLRRSSSDLPFFFGRLLLLDH